MFEAIELGHKVSREEFEGAEAELRTRLLAVQRELRAANVPVVILVNGVEGAGKSEVTNRLSAWLDTRGLVTQTFWQETDEERERPGHWRFWTRLPSRGQIAVFFGSWYTYPIVERAFERMDDHVFLRAMNRINDLERLLALDGMLVVKIWLHLSKADQEKRLDKRGAGSGKGGKGGDERRAATWEKAFTKRYDVFSRVSEAAIRATDTGACPWHLIEAKNKRHRDLSAGRVVLAACEARLAEASRAALVTDATPNVVSVGEELTAPAAAPRTVLDTVDLGRRMEEEEYREQLAKYQKRLGVAAWEAWRRGIATVVAFEGWDAAGKGGAIRRLTDAVDARLFRVVPVAAPTAEERGYHYLWRFWRNVPRDGYVRIFDRSWYGRVLVERVEGFATPAEWRRAYRELTHFEGQLTEHGVVLTKLWIHLSPEEQLRRFEERQATAWKAHKITAEDWRNRDKWDAYATAVNDMVARTSTADAPWVIVPGDDKRWARVEVVKTVCKRLEAALAKP